MAAPKYPFLEFASKHQNAAIIYEKLLSFCRQNNIKVLHKSNLFNEAWYNFQQRTIWVPAQDKGKPWGVHFLVHEMTHYFDHAAGKYMPYFEDGGFETKKSIKAGIQAERNAEKVTKKFLDRCSFKAGN